MGDTRTVVRRPSTAIGGDDVGRCLTRLHHDRFTPAIAVEDAIRDRAIARGVAFEEAVLPPILSAIDGAVDLGTIPFSERASATAEAMRAGVPAIAGARLEHADASLVGMPDLLISDEGGYLAIDVKAHKVVGSNGIESFRAPIDSLLAIDTDPTPFRSYRRRDLLQVAHYRELLVEAGFASERPLGGVIGTDEPFGISWVDLTDGDPSILEQWQSEVDDIRAAFDRGSSDPGRPLAEPWFRRECETCPWLPTCLDALESADDPTLLRGVTDAVRAELRAEDVRTIRDVAALPLQGELVDDSIVLQARARSVGRLLTPAHHRGPLPLPSASVEVDLDIETYGERTYLAGLLITEGSTSRYEPIGDWTDTDAGERRVLEHLFERFATWTTPETIVFHWTDYEVWRLAEGAQRHGLGIPGWESVEAWFEANAVDLCAWSREYLVSPAGYSLKVIAPLCGFEWRDDDPGGLQSEIWFEALLAGDEPMRDRLLTYNEDDVIAQLRVREFIRRADVGSGPGSAIPSVAEWPIDPR